MCARVPPNRRFYSPILNGRADAKFHTFLTQTRSAASATTAMSALGQKRTYALQHAMSALPPIATAKADMPQW